MSIFGAMATAISGLTAQSAAFTNIGDNLANSQTVGYKTVDTSFEDYISTSTPNDNESGAVVARPEYNNTVQGTVSQTSNTLNMAISGQGFFPVSVVNGTNNGQPTFNSQQQYTREGDFTLDSSGYLVNSTGHYLNGWAANSSGQIDQTKLVPLQVGQSGYAPVATSTATIAANLPATPSSTTPITTELPVYDAEGTSHNLDLSWTQSATPNTWTLSISQDGSATPLGTVDVAFGTAGNAAAPQGTIGSVTATSGSVTGSTFTAGQPATVNLSANFGLGSQPISLNLGSFGGTDGVTQFAGNQFNLISVSQNGAKPGSFSSVSMQTNGDVVVNYDNGATRVLAQVPVVTFSNPDALQTQDGQAYTATPNSGQPRVTQTGSNGAGSLVTSSVEDSNVDIAREFTKLIVAQRAYSANTKMVTTADDLLQQTIDMKR